MFAKTRILGRSLLKGISKFNYYNSTKLQTPIRYYSIKVALLGAMGSVGQPLSLMLKQSPWFEEVALYDVASTKGLVMELSHVDSACLVTGHDGAMGLKAALKGAQIVVMAAGQPRKLGQNRGDMFGANANVVVNLCKTCAEVCPQALLAIVTNPINSMVPVACEVYKQMNGCVDPGRIFGMTTLDAVRASTFVSELLQIPPETVQVPVIGGHSGTTMVPVLSKSTPSVHLSTEETVRITRAIQTAGDDVLKAKENTGPATLSVAFATSQLASSFAKALLGHSGITECAYVMSNIVSEVKYFASPVELGPTGVQKIMPLPDLTHYECCLLETAIPYLKKDIEMGIKYVNL